MTQLVGALVLLVLLATPAVWVLAVLALVKRRELVPLEPHRPVPWGGVEVGLMLMAFLFADLGAGLIVLRVSGAEPAALADLPQGVRLSLVVASAAARLLALAVVLGLIRLFHPSTGWKDFGWNASKFVADLRLGALAFVMLATPVYALQLILVQFYPSRHPLMEMLKEQQDVAFLVASGFAAVIAAPIVEEVVFRVLLLGWLLKVGQHLVRYFEGPEDGNEFEGAAAGESSLTPIGKPSEPTEDFTQASTASDDDPHRPTDFDMVPDESVEPRPFLSTVLLRLATVWGPIFVSSLLFALLHVNHGPDWVPLFVLAVGLGYLYHKTHRVMPCIVVHFLLNGLSLLLLLAELSGGE